MARARTHVQWGSPIIPLPAALFCGRKLCLSIASKNRQKAAVAGKRKKDGRSALSKGGMRVAARRSSKPRQPFRKERKEEEERRALDLAGRRRWTMRGVGSRCHVLRNARTLRRKDLLFYLLPLSSPVLHSKKKDSEGGVIGRLLLFHENGGKGEPFRGREKGERTEGSVFSNHNEPSGDQATIVHRDLPRRRSANTSCTPCGCYPSFVRLRISFLPIRLSFETNFSNPSVFPINLRPFNPLCFFNASYFRVDPRSKLSIRYFFSFNLRESRNSVTIRRIDFFEIIRDSWRRSSLSSSILRIFFFSHHCHTHLSNDWAQDALHSPAINASVSFNLWSWSSNAIRYCTSLHMDTRVRFVNHGDTSGTISTRKVTSSPALGRYIRDTSAKMRRR